MQPDPPLNLNDLDTFERVARLGTFSAASEELGVPKSTIGRRVARLEAALEVALVHRGPRQVTLTASGVELEARSRQPLLELRAISRGLATERPRGVLRLTVLTDLMMSARFGSLLEAFRRAQPDVVLDIDATPRVVDIIAEGFDVGLRPETAQEDTGALMVRRLGASKRRLFASRAYVEGRDSLHDMQALEQLDWLALRERRPNPIELSRGDETRTLSPRVVAYGSDVSSVLSMLRAGMGIALLPAIYVEEEVEAGTVVPLLPEWEASQGRLIMVWPRQRFLLPRVRAFVDFVADAFSTAEDEAPSPAK